MDIASCVCKIARVARQKMPRGSLSDTTHYGSPCNSETLLGFIDVCLSTWSLIGRFRPFQEPAFLPQPSWNIGTAVQGYCDAVDVQWRFTWNQGSTQAGIPSVISTAHFTSCT